ncbi:MAG: hypothetical protein KGD64_09865 [Candidatus Heimdallarchaeota archaeon]|nr:hypothetical protein [Candidatus Heimdallarchaeota archaeon]
MFDQTYIIFKYAVAVALILGGLIATYWGIKRQNPFYKLWVAFLISYGVFEIIEVLENQNPSSLILYRILQVVQAVALIILFAASLEQSMIITAKASRILAISLSTLALYFIIIPLDNSIQSFKDLTISIYEVILTDIYGFIYGSVVLVSAFLLIGDYIRYFKLASLSKSKRLRLKRDITLLLTLMLIGFAGLVTIRRKMLERDIIAFNITELAYTFVVVLVVSFYQSQSVSHGIKAILVVDREGNPLLGYSPLRGRRISFEEKIIAASGYLAGLFHFVHEYVATSSEEQFKELKTSTSTMSFHSGERIFIIIQNKISSTILEKTTKQVIKILDDYLKDFKANEMLSENQIEHVLNILEKNFTHIS